MDLPLPHTAYDLEFDDEGRDGHAFGRPPGLRPEQWPRGRVNGLPMAHLFTVRVPEQYRCAGDDLAGLSVFQADDHVADEVEGAADVIAGGAPPAHEPEAAAFWSALGAYAKGRHPRERYREDEIGGGWAWIWLTEAELAAPACPLPDPATKEPDQTDDDCIDAWRHDRPARPLRLRARADDPNVGKRYDEWGKKGSGYIDMHSEEGERLGLRERFFERCHFGGTATVVNGGDFGPFFLGFGEALGDPNLGGGGFANLDLAAEEIDWSQ